MGESISDKQILLLLEAWVYISKRGLVWPRVLNWIENRLNLAVGSSGHDVEAFRLSQYIGESK